MTNWAIRFFKFVASLWFAVVTIVALAVVIGIGTFVESYYGTEVAQISVYRTPWFGFLLILLSFNLLASALDRIPWKKKHIGFLTTHLGIILVLFGSFVTARLGMEGQLAIQEGESGSRLTLSKPILKVLDPDSNEPYTFHIKERAFPWKGRKELIPDGEETATRVYLLQYYPKAKSDMSVRKSENGAPAIHVKLSGTMANSTNWLFLGKKGQDEILLGPAAIRFSREVIPVSDKPKTSEGSLVFEFKGGEKVSLPVDSKNISKKIQIGNSPYRVTVKRLLKDAIVDQNQLIERSDEWKNPAVEFILEGKGVKELHTVFSNFPDFPTMHGLKESAVVNKVTYEHSDSELNPAAAQNELRFIFQDGKLPKYQVKHRDQITEGVVEIGKKVATGWMDFEFQVEEYSEKAEGEKTYSPLPSSSGQTDALPVMQVQFLRHGIDQTVWLPQGDVIDIPSENEKLQALFGLETKALGFDIALKDFVMDKDPGTDKPASFKSEVTLKDISRGLERNVLIQMNEPLIYRGFKVYQSAYQLNPGQPDISIFTVAHDPGLLLKYAGAIILILGILLLFYAKPFSTLKTSDPRTRER